MMSLSRYGSVIRQDLARVVLAIQDPKAMKCGAGLPPGLCTGRCILAW